MQRCAALCNAVPRASTVLSTVFSTCLPHFYKFLPCDLHLFEEVVEFLSPALARIPGRSCPTVILHDIPSESVWHPFSILFHPVPSVSSFSSCSSFSAEFWHSDRLSDHLFSDQVLVESLHLRMSNDEGARLRLYEAKVTFMQQAPNKLQMYQIIFCSQASEKARQLRLRYRPMIAIAIPFKPTKSQQGNPTFHH